MKTNTRREEEEGKGQENERAERRRYCQFFSEPSSPILPLPFCCLLFFPYLSQSLSSSPPFLSFVIQKRNAEDTRPSSPCSFSLHSASSLHLPAFFTLAFGVHVRGAERTFVVFLSSRLDFLSGRSCLETLSGGPWEGSLREEGWWPPESCGSA